ncbi:MAG: beta-propeller fold lactonase family protein [Deltaproteobacteria bacterium]|nr:beta-propeller fold lactonase family protein [Deltaproteobacteria bacterium]
MKLFLLILLKISLIMVIYGCGERDGTYLSDEGVFVDIGVGGDIAGLDTEVRRCDYNVNQIAYQRPGRTSDGILLIDGRMITPIGKNITVNTFPMNVIEIPDKNWLVVSNGGRTLDGKKYLQVVDLGIGEVIHKYPLEGKYGNFLGLYLSKDNRTIYASGGANNNVLILKIDDQGSIHRINSISLSGFIGHLVLSKDESKIYVAQHLGDKVAIIDNNGTLQLRGSIRVGIHTNELPYAYPFWLQLSKDESRLYVSNWGDNTVSVVDLNLMSVIANINVGKNPEGIVMSPDGRFIYVANSDTDDISVIDTSKNQVTDVIKLNPEGVPYGTSPTTMDITKDGRYIFVAEALLNSVSIIDTTNNQVLGRIPVGFYPVRVVVSNDNKRIFVLNAKGNGSSPNIKGEEADEILFGSVSIIEIEDIIKKLKSYSEIVYNNNSRPSRYYEFPCENINSPVPINKNYKSPIKHIIFIIKENKTFDQVFGDMEGVKTDPSLLMFGEMFTPNTHKLAREFAVFDNCYAESEVSVQGHIWLTSSTTNDYIERNWLIGDESRLFLPGVEPASYPASEFFFHYLLKNRINFMVYGEAVGVMADLEGLYGRKPRFEKYVDRKWPGGVIWNMSPKDEERANYFRDRLKEWEKNPERMPTFIFMLLPNDHTYGVSPGKLAPDSMVSDNDYALGLVIEYLSNSIFWKESVVFVVQDDPQSGSDHIDSHRTVCLAIGPYVKRGYVSSIQYSFPSFYKTFELILGLESLYQTDLRAAPMLDVFTNTPDFRPYKAEPRRIEDKIIPPIHSLDIRLRPLAEKSLLMDFSEPDSPRNHEMHEVLRDYLKIEYPHLFR